MPSVRLEVYIQQRAAKTELAGMHGNSIKIRIAAPPVENAANYALIEFIAERLGVAKRCVRVVSGAAGRKKLLEIDGVGADRITAAHGARDRTRFRGNVEMTNWRMPQRFRGNVGMINQRITPRSCGNACCRNFR
jgi:uncharacterized protein